MPARRTIDAQITARYLRGESTADIARALDVRLATIIGRIRALNLQISQARPSRAPTTLSDSSAACPPARASNSAGQHVPDEDDEADARWLSQKRGCPPGWLVSQAEVDRLYAAGRRYEDMVFKRKGALPASTQPTSAPRPLR